MRKKIKIKTVEKVPKKKLRKGFGPEKKKKLKKPKQRGPKSIYNSQIGAYICEELQRGRSLTSICKEEGVPEITTIFTWLNPLHNCFHEDFLQAYKIAREIQAEVLADQTNDIADNGENDTYTVTDPKTGQTITKTNFDVIQRSALRVKTKQWLAAHLLPKKFSDRVQLTGEGDKPLIPTTTKLVVNFVSPKKDSNE